MSYAVKEIFYSLQGEGANSGRPALFCRFAGCNLWSGKERDRADAICRFCDTDFVGTNGTGGGLYRTASDVVDAVVAACPSVASGPPVPLVVCTGGEPLLQLDGPLIAEFHARRFEVAIETSGSIKVPPGVDWVCVSPKAGVPLAVTEGHELKLAYPQDGLDPAGFERLRFQHFFLQPIDGPDRARNTAQALEYCLSRPRWRLSLQVQKILGIR